jgi:hypothetical protein
MKKFLKILFLCNLLIFTFGIKALITYENYKGHAWNAINEGLVYAADALLVLIIFYVCCGKFKHLATKILAGIALNVGYFAALLACNYTWQAIRYNAMFLNYQAPTTPLEMARAGLKAYFSHGYPAYHWVIIAMLVLSAAVFIFKHYQNALAEKIARFLLKRVKFSPSGWATLIYFDILLCFFSEHLAQNDLDEMELIYTEINVAIAAYEARRKFDKVRTRKGYTRNESDGADE